MSYLLQVLATAALALPIANYATATQVTYLYTFDAVIAESQRGSFGGEPLPSDAPNPQAGEIISGFMDVTLDDDLVGVQWPYSSFVINDCAFAGLLCDPGEDFDFIRAYDPVTGLVNFSGGTNGSSAFGGIAVAGYNFFQTGGYSVDGGSGPYDGHLGYETSVSDVDFTIEVAFDFTSVTVERLDPAPVIPLPASWIILGTGLGLLPLIGLRGRKA